MTAAAVGVLPPGFVAAIEAAIAMALFGAMGIAAPALTPQPLSFAKYFRPQRIVVSVCATTMLMAAVVSPHFVSQAAPMPGHFVPSGVSAIEPDLSRTMSRSGGTFCRPYCWTPQLLPSTDGSSWPEPPLPVPGKIV